MTLSHCLFETTFGWMSLQKDDTGLIKSTIPVNSREICLRELYVSERPSVLKNYEFTHLVERIQSYLSGSSDDFNDISVSVSRNGTFFEKSWINCRKVPRGETRSYSWLAAQAGNPKASRAAGQAMAYNPLPIIIPCHRIIGKSGNLTGYGKGSKYLLLKEKLIQIEKATNFKTSHSAQ